MQLRQDQVQQYHNDGLLVVQAAFCPHEVKLLCEAYWRDSLIPGNHRITEENSNEVRGLYGSHQRQPEFAALVRDPRILGPVNQLLVDDVYVYQFKINAKAAFGGDKWAWHQDYLAWKICDNLPTPKQINVGVFLDDVDEFNGPVIFVPGSHRDGLVRDSRREGGAKSEKHLDPDDIALTPEQMTSLVKQHGMTSPKGPAGSLVFFHTEVVHGSAQNMSPFPRKLLLVTYNDVTNLARPVGEPRPEYVVCRDTKPLKILDMPLQEAVTGGFK